MAHGGNVDCALALPSPTGSGYLILRSQSRGSGVGAQGRGWLLRVQTIGDDAIEDGS
jgi:hypothetical protein